MTLRTLLVAVLLACGGCLVGPPAAAPANESPAATASPGSSLPSPDRCLTDRAPAYDPDDPVSLAYPAAPAAANHSAVEAFVASVERAYVHNDVAARVDGVDRVEVVVGSTEVRRRDGAFVVTLRYHLATYYGDGTHGDAWPAVSYVVNDTAVRRSESDDPPGPGEGAVLVRC